MSQKFFATCPKHLESLLEQELIQLGANETRQTLAGVYFYGDLQVAYRACLWSRIANRILLPISTLPAADAEQLYESVRAIDWSEHLLASNSLLIDFTGTSAEIKNTHFGALKVKDAIVDQLREKFAERPAIAKINPDLRVHVHLQQGQATVSIDLSGESLHKRGYRIAMGAAPLKENLAAALLYRSDWQNLVKQQAPLLDPLCGIGTILIEAGLMAADLAPGLFRDYFGFNKWLGHIPAIWKTLWQEAKERREQGLKNKLPDIRGYDGDPRAISKARMHIEQAGLEKIIDVRVKELTKLVRPTHGTQQAGLIITNPPYGERLGEISSLTFLYQHLGERLKTEFLNWQAAILTANPELGKQMGIRTHKQYNFYNGAIPCKLLLFSIHPEWFMQWGKYENDKKEYLPESAHEATSAGEQMFANRLAKNKRQIGKWARKNKINCYRIYDADMPEYSAAIDIYEGWVHVQEYAPPKTVDPQKAQQRFQEILNTIPHVLEVSPKNIIFKQRVKQKANLQYTKKGNSQKFIEIKENEAKFLINLTDYLDTGIFLDNRLLRMRIKQLANNKKFLNLFCYTATSTVYAALGGARNSISVDMSNTYLSWARRNFALNGMSEALHKLVQADCLQWLDQTYDMFDLILLDPPTFSNSKRMKDILDVQRDHVMLIQKTMKHLAKDGVLIFCTNNRRFKLEESALSQFQIKNITHETIDKDFARDPKIHQCWEIRW